MKPIHVSVHVDRPREEVFAFLDVLANHERRTRGTYVLEEAPGAGTDVSFTLEYLEAPPQERLVMPLLRMWLQRANAKAMRRLGETLR